MKKAIVPISILLLIVIGVFLYLNRFVFWKTIELDGFAINSDTIMSHLQNGKDDDKVTYENVNVNDSVYLSGKKLYVGEDKKYISRDYPIISDDASTLYVLNANGKYIDQNFIKTEAYDDSYLVDSHLFNGVNNQQVDDYEYYFMEMNNGLYANIEELTIIHEGNEYVIPVNSFICFKEHNLRYYYLYEGNFVYNEIYIIDSYDNSSIGSFSDTYIELLYKLGVLSRNKPKEEEEIEEEVVPQKEETKQKVIETLPEEPKDETGTTIANPDEWIEPEVSVTDWYSVVYTFRGKLNIYDPSRTIVKQPTFEFTHNGTTYLRKTISSVGDFVIDGFMPSNHYSFTVSYVYRNREGKKIQRQFTSGEFDTQSMEGLVVNIRRGKNDIDVKSFTINDLGVTNAVGEEVLIGTKYATVKATSSSGSLEFNLSSNDVSTITHGGTVTYTTQSLLESNTEYDVEIEFYDLAKNKLRTTNGRFNIKTRKAPPAGNIDVVSNPNNPSEVTASIDIENKDGLSVEFYKILIYNDETGEIVRERTVTQETTSSTFNNMDMNQKYTAKLICNYFDEDGVRHDNYKIDDATFNTMINTEKPIAYDVTMKKVDLDSGYDRDLSEKHASFNIQYHAYSAEDIIYTLLEEQTSVLLVNNRTNQVVDEQTVRIDKNDFVKPGIDVTFGCTDENEKPCLDSNTEYRIEFKQYIIGDSEESRIQIPYSIFGTEMFTTLKKVPEVSISNLFIAAGYIDFDPIVVDPDNACLSEDLTVEISDIEKNDAIVYNGKINKYDSAEHYLSSDNRISQRFENNGNHGKKYNLAIKCGAYNDGKTADKNYILAERSYDLSGLSGKVLMTDLVEDPYFQAKLSEEGQSNLFNINGIERWKSNGEQNTVDMMSLDNEKKIVTLKAQKGYRLYSYYLPELAGKQLTVSLKSKRISGNQQACVVNGQNATSCSGQKDSDGKSTVLSTSDAETQTFYFSNVDSSGYISFLIYEVSNSTNITGYEFKELQFIQNRDVSGYTEYNNPDNKYTAEFNAELTEMKMKKGDEEIPISLEKNAQSLELYNENLNAGNYEYRVVFRSNGVIEGEQEALSSDENVDVLEQGNYNVYINKSGQHRNLYKGKEYVMQLVAIDTELDVVTDDTITGEELEGIVSSGGRYYVLDEMKFVTDGEVRTIGRDEFFKMHTYGHYIITEDIDLRDVSTKITGTFQGHVDFDGHSLLINKSNDKLFPNLGGSAIIENVDIHLYLATEDGNPLSFQGLFNYNYGTVTDFKLTLEDINDAANSYVNLLGWQNYGTIERFAIYSKAPLTGVRELTFGVTNNHGIIKNGYVYGENVNAKYDDESDGKKSVGIFATSSTTGSTIKNVYSLVDVEIDANAPSKTVGSIVDSASNCEISNAYVYAMKNANFIYRDKTKDIMMYSASNVYTHDLYYVSSVNYAGNYSEKITDQYFRNANFQNNTINGDDSFDVIYAFSTSTFPQLKWDYHMPDQDTIYWPALNAGNKLKFLYVNSIKQLEGEEAESESEDNKWLAQVIVSLSNPENDIITGVSVEGFNDEDIEFVTATTPNNDKITSLIFKVRNPDKYISSYKLHSIKVKSLYNFQETDVIIDQYIDLDLYAPVDSMIGLLTEYHRGSKNFQLMKDVTIQDNMQIDDIGEDDDNDPSTPNAFTGKINGNNHKVTNLRTNGCLINNLKGGVLSNLVLVDYTINKKDGSAKSGLVCNATNNSVIDNVHIQRENIVANKDSSKNTIIGGIVANVDNSTVRNSSVLNIQIDGTDITNASAAIGGVVGQMANSILENSFARKVNFDVRVNNSQGIGGVVGYVSSGKVHNVYATGSITSNAEKIGGIAGQSIGRIDSAIARVDIVTEKDFIGGIVGSTPTTDRNYIQKTLALGNLTTTKSNPTNTDRSSGVKNDINANFAWDKQFINSVLSTKTNGETLLSDEDLANRITYSSKIGLSSGFNVNEQFADKEFKTGYIPALVSTDGTYVLNNQGYDDMCNNKPGCYDEQGEIKDLSVKYVPMFELDAIESIEYFHDNTPTNRLYYRNKARIRFRIKRPFGYKVRGFQLDGLKYEVVEDNEDVYKLASPDSDTITYVTLTVTPQNYRDSYAITNISYKDADGYNKDAKVAIKLNLSFYGMLHSKEDWNKLEPEVYDNYVIDNDIDFGNTAPAKTNISFSRLLGVKPYVEIENEDPNYDDEQDIQTHTIRNVAISNISAGGAFIDTISSAIRYVNFDNISIRSNTSGNYLGVIKILSGTMKNVDISNITVYGPSINNYVGFVAFGQSFSGIRNINMNNVKVIGVNQVGGLVGRNLNYDISDVYLNNITVLGNNYLGSLIGYENWDTNIVHTLQIRAKDVTVGNISKDANFDPGYTWQKGGVNGGYIGGIIGYGSGNVLMVNNANVTGHHRVGGISGEHSNRNVNYNYVSNSNITAKNAGSYYVGGATGVNQNLRFAFVTNTNINNASNLKGDQVGGISGAGGWTVYDSGTKNVNVYGRNRVGGIKGNTGWGTIRDTFVKDGIVTGNEMVGGISGSSTSRNNNLYYNITNATVTGQQRVGGIIGHIPNKSTTTADNITRVYLNIVANSKITAKNGNGWAGGLIGNVQNKLFTENWHFYRNIISASVTCTNSAAKCGYVIGYNDTEKTSDLTAKDMYHWRIFDQSTLNGPKVSTFSAADLKTKFGTNFGNGTNGKLITLDELKNYNTYSNLGMSKSIFQSGGNGKYPKVNIYDANKYYDATYNPVSDYTAIFDLPSANGLSSSLGTTGTDLYYELPDVEVYSVGVDKINVTFSDVNEKVSFYINDKEYQLNNKTYTFYYDYKEDFTIKITDKVNTKEYRISKDDVRNKSTIVGNNYYYLEDNNVETDAQEKEIDQNYVIEESTEQNVIQEDNNSEEPTTTETPEEVLETPNDVLDNEGINLTNSIGKTFKKFSDTTNNNINQILDNAVNVYDDEILLDNKKVYNIKDGTIRLNYFDNLTLVETEPIYEYDYNGQKIKTYSDYSTVDGQYVPYMMFVVNDKIEIVKQNTQTTSNNIMVDNYNGDNYLLYLNKENKLVNVKDKITFPKNFKNYGIESISSNINKKLLFVEYENGNYVMFNYMNGEIYASKNDYVPSLMEYIREYMSVSKDKQETTTSNNNYNQVKELVSKLEVKPISTVKDDNGNEYFAEKNDYSIVYDPVSDSYDVYQIPLVEKTERGKSLNDIINDNSVLDVINGDEKLIEYYKYGNKNKVNIVSSIFIVLGIVAIIGAAIVVLRKLLKNTKYV